MKEIYLIDETDELTDILKEKLKTEKVKIKKIKQENLDIALKDIPALILINETEDMCIEEVCHTISNNDDNAITPIIVIAKDNNIDHKKEILKSMATYVFDNKVDKEILYLTIKNIINLLYVNRKVSPLTNLPGNVQIQAEMKKRLTKNEFFVMLYLDLDNFKAYNDIYGFSNGDEIIKYTARTIINNVHSKEDDNNFIGHIGGDDFIAIVEDQDYEKICQNIVAEFDEGITNYFNKDDLKRGFLEVENRKGIIEQFPITSISIGVVEVDPGRFNNTLEIGEVGAQVKHLAKSIVGSTYVINRRK